MSNPDLCIESETSESAENDNVSENQIKFSSELEGHLHKIAKQRYVESYVIEKKNINEGGNNYMGCLYEVNIKGVSMKENCEINLFIKRRSPGLDMMLFPVQSVYMREMFVYDELSKIYENIQIQVPFIEQYEFVKCYGLVKEERSECIILENMIKKGYNTCDKTKCISLKFAESSIMQLAKYHALSFALEKFNPDYFESKIKPMTTLYVFNDDWTAFVKNVSKTTLKIYESTPMENIIEDYIEKIIVKFPKYYEATERSVLLHGDYRANNILIKEEDGNITKIIPVDYQIVQYGCPIIDLSYFIFTGTDKAFRKKYLHHLKVLYRDTMGKFLKYFNMDLEEVYPTNIFENDFKDKLDYGLMVAIIFMPFILATEEKAPDLTSTKVSDLTVESNNLFEERVRGIVDDFIEWGYL